MSLDHHVRGDKVIYGMACPTIVYLDQNHLANMARAHLDLVIDNDHSEFWKSLSQDLRKAVLANEVACFELEFQRDEAGFGKGTRYAVWQFICYLSLALEFQTYEIVRALQEEIDRQLSIAPGITEHCTTTSHQDKLDGLASRIQVSPPEADS